MVLPNLYGDILTDEAAEFQGGVGTAGSANIGKRYAMFEAIHGSAPRMVDEGRAAVRRPQQHDPRRRRCSSDHIGFPDRGKKLEMALDICGNFEKKLVMTGRDTGANGSRVRRLHHGNAAGPRAGGQMAELSTRSRRPGITMSKMAAGNRQLVVGTGFRVSRFRTTRPISHFKENHMRAKVTIVGAGMTGGTMAQRLAETGYVDVILAGHHRGPATGQVSRPLRVRRRTSASTPESPAPTTGPTRRAPTSS